MCVFSGGACGVCVYVCLVGGGSGEERGDFLHSLGGVCRACHYKHETTYSTTNIANYDTEALHAF